METLYFYKGEFYTEYSDAVSGVPSFERGRVSSPFERNWKRFKMQELPCGVTLVIKMP